jgi:hypothetical protein
MELTMNKLPLLTAVAIVLGTSAAFAGSDELLKPDFATTYMCNSLEDQYRENPAMNHPDSQQLADEQNAMSYCRTNRDNQDKFADRAEARDRFFHDHPTRLIFPPKS